MNKKPREESAPEDKVSPLKQILGETRRVGWMVMFHRLLKGIAFALSFKQPKRTDLIPEADLMIIVPFGGFDPEKNKTANQSNLDLASGAENLQIAYKKQHGDYIPVYSQWEFSEDHIGRRPWGKLVFTYGDAGNFHIQTYALLKSCMDEYWRTHPKIDPKRWSPRVYLVAEYDHYLRCYGMLKKLGCTVMVNNELRPVSKHDDSRQAWCRRKWWPLMTRPLDPHAPCGFFWFERLARILAALLGQV